MNLKEIKRTILLIDNGVNLVDLSAPLQAFKTANDLLNAGKPAYEVIVRSVEGGLVETTCGLPLITTAFSNTDLKAMDTLIIIGGLNGQDYFLRSNAVAEVVAVLPFFHRICAIGTGIFLLAATGQIADRHVAAHWSDATALQTQYPAAHVDADKIYLRDGNIWTSAGSTASFDLILALIEEDCGYTLAIRVARQMVLFMKRSGWQSQLSIPLTVQLSTDRMFSELHAWMAGHLHEDLCVARLAEEACMSARTFARIYSDQLGRTPAKTVEAMRLEAACRALENSAIPLKSIASKVGMLTEQNLQRAFKRVLGISPSHYRAMYQDGVDVSINNEIFDKLQRKNRLDIKENNFFKNKKIVQK